MNAVYPPQPNHSQSGPQPMAAPLVTNVPVAVWGATDKGRQREGNEDAVYPHSGSDTFPFEPGQGHLTQKGQLLVIADGVGGARAGSEASRWAIRVAVERYYDLPGPDLGADLRTSIEKANASLYQYLQSTGVREAGCTMAAAVIHGRILHVANVGDSRVYLLRNGQITQLTRDHTLTQQKIDHGLIRPEQAKMDPDSNVLTRSLGARQAVQVDLFPPLQLAPGDVVLLCSDGLTDMLDDAKVARLVGNSSPKRAAQRLIAAANKRGGFDNISVTIARVGGGQPQAGGGLLKNIGRMSSRQRGVAMGLAALVVVVLCGLIGWTMREAPKEPPAPTPTPIPATTVEIEAMATPTPTVVPTTEQPTDTVPPGDPTSTARPTVTLTNTPRPPAATYTLTPSPEPTESPTPTPGGEDSGDNGGGDGGGGDGGGDGGGGGGGGGGGDDEPPPEDAAGG